MTVDTFPNYSIMMCLMDEIPDQLGLKCKHSSKMEKKDVEKLLRSPQIVAYLKTKLLRK
jgi:hypothetical protein